MVVASVASHLCRPVSLQLNQSVTTSFRAAGACIVPPTLRHPPSSSAPCKKRAGGPAFLSTAQSRSPVSLSGSQNLQTRRILSSSLSRRPLMKGFLKGLLGFMVVGGTTGISTGTPPALARAKNPEIEKVRLQLAVGQGGGCKLRNFFKGIRSPGGQRILRKARWIGLPVPSLLDM